MNRRVFIKKSCSCAALTAIPLSVLNLTSCSDSGNPVAEVEVEEVVSDDRIFFIFDLTNESLVPLQTIGNSIVTSGNEIDSAGLLLLRLSENEVVVFSRNCTHSGASVNSFQNGISLCNSHGSEFNTSGEVVTGPATRPLKKYESILDGTDLTIFAS